MNTGYHAPIVLADERAKRARKQRPYPAVFEMPTPDEIAEADEREDIARANRCFRVLAVLFIALLLIALGVHFHFR